MTPEVYLFGEPRATLNETVHRFGASRRYQLLAYLACKRAWVSREQLADVFWSHTDSGAARRNLRKVLFEAKNLSWMEGLEQDERGVRWQVATDVAAFEDALKREAWAEAVATYGGPFLEGLSSDNEAEFESWLRTERERFGALYQAAAEHHAEALARAGDAGEALNFLRGLLEQDALNERVHRQVMRLEFGRGRVEAALEQFERCREALKRDLGVEPLGETLELLGKIEQGGGAQAKLALLLTTPESVPSLPVDLIGREKVFREALELVQKGGRVLLHGFGGMGKTALAAVVAKGLLESDGAAVLWLPVGSDTPDVTFDALAYPLEAQQDLAGAEDKAKAFQAALHRQGVKLLVLDDVWNAYTLSSIMDALPDGLPLLVTSRQRYPKLTRLYVDRLERGASLELLNHYAARELLGEGAGELCELLGDHPFALRLAGLALREQTALPEALYERIRNAPHDLNVPSEFQEVKQESVASLLNVSLEALKDRPYETFLSYGLLEVPVASAGFLAGCLDRDVGLIEDALFALVQRGLAERVSQPGNDLVGYRLHDLAHSYARANRFQRPTTLVRSSLAFLKTYKDDVELLELDIGNILAAVQLVHEQQREPELVTLMYLLTVEGAYYTARGHNQRSVGFLEAAAKLAEAQGRLEEAHYLFAKLGEYHINFTKDYPRAFTFYSDSRRVARVFGNRPREAVLLGLMALARFHQGEADADRFLDQAYRLAKQTGDDECLCRVLDCLAQVAGLRGDMVQANRLLRESLGAIERLQALPGTKRAEAVRDRFFVMLNLGETEFRIGNFDAGVEIRKRALQTAEAEKNQIWMGYASYELGDMHHQVGEHQTAKRYLLQALELFAANNAMKDVETVQTFLKSAGYL